MGGGRVPSAALALGFWVIHRRRSAAEAKEKQKSRNKVDERWGGGDGPGSLRPSLSLFALRVKSCLFCYISWKWLQTELCSQPSNTWWPSLRSTFPLTCTFIRATVFYIGDSLSPCSPQYRFCSKHGSTKKNLTQRGGVREGSEAGKGCGNITSSGRMPERPCSPWLGVDSSCRIVFAGNCSLQTQSCHGRS